MNKESIMENKNGHTNEINQNTGVSISSILQYVEFGFVFGLKCIIIPPCEELWDRTFTFISCLLGGIFILFSNLLLGELFKLEVFPVLF